MLSYNEIVNKIETAKVYKHSFIGIATTFNNSFLPDIRITSVHNAEALLEQYKKVDNVLAVDSSFDAGSLFYKLFTENSRELIIEDAFSTISEGKEETMTEEKSSSLMSDVFFIPPSDVAKEKITIMENEQNNISQSDSSDKLEDKLEEDLISYTDLQ